VLESFDNTVLPALENLLALRNGTPDPQKVSLGQIESLVSQVLHNLANAICQFEDSVPLEILDTLNWFVEDEDFQEFLASSEK